MILESVSSDFVWSFTFSYLKLIFFKDIEPISCTWIPGYGSIRVRYLSIKLYKLAAATFPYAIFFIKGDTCPTDDPPIKKQKNVEITTGAEYPKSQIINCFPYQNPKEYSPRNIKVINPRPADEERIYFITVFWDYERTLINLFS